MALTWPVVAAVLFGALLHAGWNALVKAGDDKVLDNAFIGLGGSLLAVPLVLVAGLPPPAAWPYLALSLVIHVGYYASLSRAYQHGDLSLTYPLMRGTPPLLVAAASGVFADEALSPLAWAGVAGISGGVLLLGLSRAALRSPAAVGFALANAALIACYTIVDGIGVRVAGHAVQYVGAFFLVNGGLFTALVFARRGRRAVLVHARQRGLLMLGAAAASGLSYGIALWAMTRAPVAAVAALREVSVLFAALIGAWLLKEGFEARRLLGAAIVVAGVVAMRLG